jgi:HNH endonuclease
MNVAEKLAKRTRRDGECLIWTGDHASTGYGRMRMNGRRHKYAHRIVYELAHGPIPEGMLVCHKCDVRNCVELSHLFLGTHSDNSQDMSRKGRGNTAKLSPLQVDQLRVLFAAGFSYADVESYYPKVSRLTLYRIKSRKIWKTL